MEEISCEADAMDAFDQIEDALESFGLVAALMEPQCQGAQACFMRELARLAGARVHQVGMLRRYAADCARSR